MRVCGAAILFLGGLASSSCVIESLDLSDRRCPCATGYVCRPALDRCCRPAIEIQGFRASWATANSIRWEWSPRADPSRFLRYELVIAENSADLVARTGTAIVFDETINPELGGFVLPRTSGNEDIVTATITDGLRPGTTYLARLQAFDNELCPAATDVAIAETTIDPPETIEIYRDEAIGGANPTNFQPVPDPEGGMHLAWGTREDMECMVSGRDLCPNNLRRGGFDVPIDRISRGAFESAERTAMLEMTVTHDSSTPSFYSKVWLRVVENGSCGRPFQLEPMTLRAARAGQTVTQRIQVPLAALQADDASAARLSFEGLTSVCEFNVGGAWLLGSTVWVDDVLIRY